MAMNTDEIILALTPLVEVFEGLGIAYHVGGSVASSIYGIPRPTQDVDIVADLQSQQVRSLVKQLETQYYIDADSVRDAISRRSSFNVIHLDTMLKVDIFIPKSRHFARQERLRARLDVLEEGTRPFYFASPEDMVLNKLEWYRMGNEISARQWNDVLGVLKENSTHLDLSYLQEWATTLKVADLLERALIEAGFKA